MRFAGDIQLIDSGIAFFVRIGDADGLSAAFAVGVVQHDADRFFSFYGIITPVQKFAFAVCPDKGAVLDDIAALHFKQKQECRKIEKCFFHEGYSNFYL
jgi:hypothetical protein